ncbi:3'-5' exoribonuclease [Mycolicibacterium mageritense]|uniref:3'-5' exonuclease n=1 Tax=Mycolicibacterium mageritense TaxID=53462 RepID=A0AAI8U2V2_MYCME|nr:3'-5' exoribonuclease [Mycolicibacterium mageritense]BDY33182.1 hypothetical protein hbim_07157 [Mycolicibacterium mageritense]
MTDYVFLDTETLGLDPAAPVWEFAAVRRFADGSEDKTEFQIRHDPAHWLDQLAEQPNGQQFVDDYANRYDHRDAASEFDAAVMMNIVTRGAVVIGCNPSFDLERIARLLRKHGMEPDWHYRPVCVTTFAAAALHVCADALGIPISKSEIVLALPWSSDEVSRSIGVNPDDYDRHTAIGDVRWALAQWDAITGRPR